MAYESMIDAITVYGYQSQHSTTVVWFGKEVLVSEVCRIICFSEANI